MSVWAWPSDGTCNQLNAGTSAVEKTCKMLGLSPAAGTAGLISSAVAVRGTARSGDSTDPTLLLKNLEDAAYQVNAKTTGTSKLADASAAYLAW